MNNKKTDSEKTAKSIFNFFGNLYFLLVKFSYYYYFLLAILSFIFYYLKFDNAFNIVTVLTLFSILIDLLRGNATTFIKIIFYIVASLIVINFFIKNTWIGISIAISIIHLIEGIIKIFIIKFFSFMFKHYN